MEMKPWYDNYCFAEESLKRDPGMFDSLKDTETKAEAQWQEAVERIRVTIKWHRVAQSGCQVVGYRLDSLCATLW